MSPFIELHVGSPYALSGMKPEVGTEPGRYAAPHPKYGMPKAIIAWYAGFNIGLPPERVRWHVFELRVGGVYQNTMFMRDTDLETLEVSPL